MNPQAILNFNEALDVQLLDQVVAATYSGQAPPAVHEALVAFQSHPAAWTRVAGILEQSQRVETKAIALNILATTVKQKWQVLPAEQREGIRNFLVNMVITISRDPARLAAQHLVVSRANLALVQVLKKDWPARWPNFISELVASSRTSESVCANNMRILQLLSEEIFDYSRGQMTEEKTLELKRSLNNEFKLIYQLCSLVLESSKEPKLISITLKTLQRFLRWIPVGFIFETNLIEMLCVKFFPPEIFRNDTLLCLAEIGGLQLKKHPEYNPKFLQLFASVTQAVSNLLTPDTNVAQIYAQGNPNVRTFVRYLTIFLSAFLRSHLPLLENGGGETRAVLQTSLTFLLRMSQVDDKEVFSICLDYWNALVSTLYKAQRQSTPAPLRLGQQFHMAAGGMSGGPGQLTPRVQFYAPMLSQVRLVLIARMVKPKEVLIVRNADGDYVRESGPRDTEALVMYRNMREALVYLTHLDPKDTQDTMLMKLTRQVDGSEWSHDNLSTLCWAVGSISGALSVAQEKSFLVRVIKDLLRLCEMKRGKRNKAVVASNIMYVVGQYPRFLRMHWRFLRTVVMKLFEFMHEKHPGVQDMSCETFLKIAQKCRHKFVSLQEQEPQPFVETILQILPHTVQDLEQHQIELFYEAVATIIFAQQNPEQQQHLLMQLMTMPNQAWAQVVGTANQNLSVLWEAKTIKNVTWVLRTNKHVAQALGPGYVVQLSRIYMELLQLYKLYSGFISNEIQTKGEKMVDAHYVRAMRTVKKETLSILSTFFSKCKQEQAAVVDRFLPPLTEPVLVDYQRCVPPAREPEVLLLWAEIIETFGEAVIKHLAPMFESLFQSTLSMITSNFEDNPDHRIAFFTLVKALQSRCFRALLMLTGPQFQLVMDSIVWAIKHLEPKVAETGLHILRDLLRSVEGSEAAGTFYQTFYISTLTQILAVLTDAFHTAGFANQASIVAHLFSAVASGSIPVQLFPRDGPVQHPNNLSFVRAYTADYLSQAFPNVARQKIEQYVQALLQNHADASKFRSVLRDLLVEKDEFSAPALSNENPLYAEERRQQQLLRQQQEQARLDSVPGLDPAHAGKLADMAVDDE